MFWRNLSLIVSAFVLITVLSMWISLRPPAYKMERFLNGLLYPNAITVDTIFTFGTWSFIFLNTMKLWEKLSISFLWLSSILKYSIIIDKIDYVFHKRHLPFFEIKFQNLRMFEFSTSILINFTNFYVCANYLNHCALISVLWIYNLKLEIELDD